MDEKQIWLVLGIEATKEEEEIKQAYRSRLVSTNPEEDPEGFKRLRKAYEMALELAAETDSREMELPEGPVGDWLMEIRDVYNWLPSRIDEKVWKELLENDVCVSLETMLDAREALLKFLTDHFRLPGNIWKIVDEKLSLQEDMEDLQRRFPLDFLNYIQSKCTQEEWFPFQLFEGPGDGDYDTWLNCFYEMRNIWREGKADEALARYRELEETGIYHPYQDAVYAAILVQKEEKGKARELMLSVVEKTPEDSWLRDISGQVKMAAGDEEGAYTDFLKVLEKDPSSYMAGLRCGQYEGSHGKEEEAKARLIHLVDIGYDTPDVRNAIREVNERLIPVYREKWEAEREDLSLFFKLGWCLLQNEDSRLGVELMEDIVPDEKNQAEYHSLLGRFYYNEKDYARAEKQFGEWVESIRREKVEEEKDKQELPARFATAYSLLAASRKMQENYEGALEAAKEALARKEEPNFRQLEADALLRLGRYQECVDVCDRILEQDKGYLPALLTRQEAYFELHMAQQVVDDFYAIKDIYAGLAKPYELAAEVFHIYRQHKDTLHIVEQAEEAGVSSRKLELLKVKARRLAAEEKEAYEEVYKLAADLLTELEEDGKRLQEEAPDGVLPEKEREKLEQQEAEVFREMALCQASLGDIKTALKRIDAAVRLDPSYTHIWVKGDLLYQNGSWSKALEAYEEVKEIIPENADIWTDMAACYKNTSQEKKEIECLEQAVRLNPKHPRAYSRLAAYYRDKYGQREKKEDYEKALDYSSRQLEQTPEAYYYIERGQLFIESCEWQKAEADFEKAAQLEPENAYAYYNWGCSCKYSGRYEEALRLFEKAVSLRTEKESIVFFRGLGDCFERLRRFDKAAEAYEKNKSEFPENASVRWDLAELYCKIGTAPMLDRAILETEEILELKKIRKSYYLVKLADIYQLKEDYAKAIELCEKALKEEPGYSRAYMRLADIYLNGMKNSRKALKTMKTAFVSLRETDALYEDCLRVMTEILGTRGSFKAARSYGDKAIGVWEKEYGSLQAYLDMKKYRNARLYLLGKVYYFSGRMKEAADSFHAMTPCLKEAEAGQEQPANGMCRHCSSRECWEYYAGQGLLAQAAGDFAAACGYYRRALDIDSSDSSTRLRFRECMEAAEGKKQRTGFFRKKTTDSITTAQAYGKEERHDNRN